ncbi:alpha/beta hydrolase [Mesorhizobium australicum]|uniref:Acetyl esterase/lipase n=1 Tax=Mesorhizobium australicum TaxID=536018 RepID=A0A1X7PFK8_9HYPH|nr:alpha/beta hydrolase [Mesorhizobium australicum]SMH50030.1 Acetyl esterase/lipase [Mesorhizobium australicum]
MPSLKSRIVSLYLRSTRKKAFASAAEMNRWIARARTLEDHRPPASVARRLDIARREVFGSPVYDVAPRGGHVEKRILYLHGGAYVFEITPFHWRLIAEMAERLDARITVPVYPLAPEHRFEEMFGMVMQTYRRMLAEEPAGEIVFMGDSAGGNMAVVLTMMAAKEGLPGPDRHVLISPGLDMTLENPDVAQAARLDPWLDIEGGLEAIRHYAPHLDRADWRISPIKGDLSVLPPMLILAGEFDLLTLDTIRFADLARRAGVEVELVVEPGMMHVWPLIDMPEARRARNLIVEFLNSDAPGRDRRRMTEAASLRAY